MNVKRHQIYDLLQSLCRLNLMSKDTADTIVRHVDYAIAEERERAAVVAEQTKPVISTFAYGNGDVVGQWHAVTLIPDTIKSIVQRIRDGVEPKLNCLQD